MSSDKKVLAFGDNICHGYDQPLCSVFQGDKYFWVDPVNTYSFSCLQAFHRSFGIMSSCFFSISI